MATSARSPDFDDKTDESPTPPRQANAPAPVLEPNEARGGTTHNNVRYVLAISLVVIVIAFVVIYFGFVAGPPPTVPPPG